MVLEDDARPAKLRSCNPWGETKFSLQMRKGGLVSQGAFLASVTAEKEQLLGGG